MKIGSPQKSKRTLSEHRHSHGSHRNEKRKIQINRNQRIDAKYGKPLWYKLNEKKGDINLQRKG